MYVKTIIYFQKERQTWHCVNNAQMIDFAADIMMGRASCILHHAILYKTILYSKVEAKS